MIPTVLLLAVLHTVIILSIIHININSSALSSIMRTYNGYISDATSLLAGSSLLSETSSIYVLMPFDEEGQPNVSSLVAYVNELQNPRAGPGRACPLCAAGHRGGSGAPLARRGGQR